MSPFLLNFFFLRRYDTFDDRSEDVMELVGMEVRGPPHNIVFQVLTFDRFVLVGNSEYSLC